jgi:hypothetical protein
LTEESSKIGVNLKRGGVVRFENRHSQRNKRSDLLLGGADCEHLMSVRPAVQFFRHLKTQLLAVSKLTFNVVIVLLTFLLRCSIFIIIII